MLKEIRSKAFKINAKTPNESIRPTIIFNDGLNIVNGSDTGTNSIGKSNFLMCIDFCFGGNDYYEKSKPVQTNIGDHEIEFAFEFNGIIHRFCRSTSSPDIVIKCDENYNKTEEKMSVDEFTKWLNSKYNNSTLLSFRALVSLYIRVYNRENLDENYPLKSFNKQTDAQSIEVILKLFNLYDPIKESAEKSKEASNKKTAFTDAQKYEYIPKITKTRYKENLKKIEELEVEKETLANNSEKGLLDLNSSQADLISRYKSELTALRRQRGKLFTQLDTIKKDKPEKKESLQQDFSMLTRFFPEININRLMEVEEFHKTITDIMSRQVKESEQKIWNLINMLNEQIKSIELKLEEISQVKNVSKVVLDKYALIDREIEQLKLENEKYLLLETLTSDHKEKEEKLVTETMNQAEVLENLLNEKMKELNTYIFGKSINNPEFHIETPKRYSFYTPNDDGTGTNFKGLIVMDLATLLLTSLPVLVHDSVVLKQISNESIEKIFEIYNSSKKQIFVAIDKENSYSIKTQEIILKKEILKLSSGGNELYGYDFSKMEDK